MMQAKLFAFLSVEFVNFLICTGAPTNLKFVNFQVAPRRSIPYTVEVVATKSAGLDDFYYKWTVTEFLKKTEILTSREASIYIDGYQFPSDTVFKRRYTLKVIVSHYPDLSRSARLSQHFKFVADSMHLEIKGGHKRSHAADSDLILDASISKDISYPPNEDAFAGNSIVWTVRPELNFTTKGLILKVDKNNLRVGKFYAFTMKMGRHKIRKMPLISRVQQIVKIVEPGNPELFIRCVRNCIYPNYLQSSLFKVDCVSNCKNLNYQWTIRPILSPDSMDFGRGDDKFLVKDNAYKPGTKVEVTVRSGGGMSGLKFQFVDNFVKGSCEVIPKSGISGVTLFNVVCKGFFSYYGIVLYMIFQKYETTSDDGVMLNADLTPDESVYLSEGFPALLTVRVVDNVHMTQEVVLLAVVLPYPHNNLVQLTKVMLEENRESVYTRAKAQDRNSVVQLTSLLLNAIDGNKEISTDAREDLHKHLAWAIFNVKPNTFYTAFQTLTILKKFSKYRIREDTYTSRIMARSVKEAAVALYFAMTYRDLSTIPIGILKKLVTAVFNFTNDFSLKSREVDLFLKRPTPIEVQDYDSYDEWNAKKLKIRDDLRELTENLVLCFDVTTRTLVHEVFIGEKSLIFETEQIGFMQRRIALKTITGWNSITIPSFDSSSVEIKIDTDEKEKFQFIDIYLVVFDHNPFWWHANISKLSGHVLVFSILKGCKENEQISVAKEYSIFEYLESCEEITIFRNPVIVNIFVKKMPKGVIKGLIRDGDNIIAHRFAIEDFGRFIIHFKPDVSDYRVTYSTCYCKEKDFIHGKNILADAKWDDAVLSIDIIKVPKFLYICFKKLGMGDTKYKGTFAFFTCVSWDSLNGHWVSEGCSLIQAKLKNDTVISCKCEHLSMFSGFIFLPDNQLNHNIDIDFDISKINNWTTVLFISFLWGLWLLLFFWAWSKDRKFKKLNIIHKLDDNVPGDSNGYLMVVFTGLYVDAKTTADVAFQLIGVKSRSRIHLIRYSNVRVLQRNMQDWFLVFTPQDLGSIRKLRMWHNSRGRHPHWYCEKVLIQNLKTGTQFCFIVEKWFSLVWGKGKIYHIIPVTEEISFGSRVLLFSATLKPYLVNQHTMLGIYTRDAQSNYNCKERVTVLICSLFLSGLLFVLLDRLPSGKPNDSIDNQGTFFLTTYSLKRTIEVGVITAIGIHLIKLIFLNSYSRKEKKSRKTKKKEPILE